MADESEDIEASTSVSTSAVAQLLNVTPKDLYFSPPYAKEVTASINLHNPNSEPVTFKIKTTAPKRYIVRPPLGICPPGQSVDISVTLSYNKEPPTHPERGDKFQVQSFILKSTAEVVNPDGLKELWRGKPTVVKTKIAAHFSEPPTSEVPAVVNTPAEPVTSAVIPENPVTAVVEPTTSITSTTHAAKPRITEALAQPPVVIQPASVAHKLASFDNYVDPVSTLAPGPTTTANIYIPLALVFLLGLLLGFFLGMSSSSSSTSHVNVAAKP